MEPTSLLAKVRGALCVFSPKVDKKIWVPKRCIPVTQDEDPGAPSAPGDDSGSNNRIMGDGESAEKPTTLNVS